MKPWQNAGLSIEEECRQVEGVVEIKPDSHGECLCEKTECVKKEKRSKSRGGQKCSEEFGTWNGGIDVGVPAASKTDWNEESLSQGDDGPHKSKTSRR